MTAPSTDTSGTETKPDVLADAAAGREIGAQDASALFAYYMENGRLPGATTLDLYARADGKPYHFVVRRLEWDEWDANRRRATSDDGVFDQLTAAAWNVATALEQPKLGPFVTNAQQQAKAAGRRDAPRNAADLLRGMFADGSSGTLLELASEVLEFSELQGLGPGTVTRTLQAAAGN